MQTKEFYKNINQSNDLDFQYKKWSKYRDNIFSKMEKHLTNKDVIILGAGNCNDLRLEKMKDETKSLTLVDIDIKSMKDGIKRQNLDIKDFKLKELDMTGLSDNFYKEFENMLIKKISPDSIFNKLEKIANQVKLSNIINEKFDVIISTPVYSQLVYSKLFSMLDKADYKEKEKMKRKIIDLMPQIIINYNEFIFSMKNDNSVIIIWTDLMEFKSGKKIDRNNLDKIYSNYIHKYGIGIPGYGLIDISKRINVSKEFWDIWPFNKEKKYLIKGIIGNTTK